MSDYDPFLSMKQAMARQREAYEAQKVYMKDQERKQEEERAVKAYGAYLAEYFDERELRLIANCCTYAASDPAGLPGHNLMIIVAKLANLMGIDDVPD